MANTISVKVGGYDGRYVVLTCSQTMDVSNNKSIIKWVVSTTGGEKDYAYSTGPTKAVVNGITVYEEKRISYKQRVFPATIGSKSGQIEVKHNADGNKAISISLSSSVYYAETKTASATWTLDAIPKGATIVAAPNFTDVENPTIQYSVPNANIESLQACISLTGAEPDIPYRDIDASSEYYTFELTEEEKNILYAATNEGKPSRTVYFYIRTVIDGEFYFKNSGPKTFTITDCEPALELTSFQEADEEIIAGQFQVGEEFPAYFYELSDIAYTLTPTLKKGATVKECFFGIDAYNENGKPVDGKYATTLSGVIKDITASYYEAYIVDSRGYKVELFDRFPMVPYVVPTINMDANIEVLEETIAVATLKVDGELYIGSLGNRDNTFRIDYRYKENGGDWGEWKFGTDTADFGYDDTNYVDTYSAELVINDLNYLNSYEFQTRVVDSVRTVESRNSKVLSIIPVFDWSRYDFNFNVPIHIKGVPMADFVIETGTEPMGTNGTWYWSKWNSGKAECYGCRNYGNMGVSNVWGQLYESATFSQDLPSGLFANAPEVVSINFRNSNLGAWVEQKGTGISADSTGTFFVVRATSGTLSQVHLSFNIVGRWK